MALIYQAEIVPSKLDLLHGWLVDRPWFVDDPREILTNVASYRFDDPDGEVGIETILVRSGDGALMQIPVTYRAAPLAMADGWLIGTMTHSVLGERFVYDAVGDPVYLAELVRVVMTGGTSAELFLFDRGALVPLESSASAVGDGRANATVATIEPVIAATQVSDHGAVTTVTTGDLRIALARVLDGGLQASGSAQKLVAHWPRGQGETVATVSTTVAAD